MGQDRASDADEGSDEGEGEIKVDLEVEMQVQAKVRERKANSENKQILCGREGPVISWQQGESSCAVIQ